MPTSQLPDPTPIIDLMEAFRCSKAMFVAVSLGVFDRLECSPSRVDVLASLLNCQVDPLERLLDACVGLKLLRKQDGVYSNRSVASVYLCRTSAHALVGYILYSDEVLLKLWSHLESAVRSGGAQWKETFKQDGGIFDQFFRTDEAMHTFLKGMHGLGMLSSDRVVSAFDLSRFRTFVDLGGGTGHLAIAACKRYPNLRAILFDLDRVIDAIRPELSRSPVSSRIQLMKGDFFHYEQLPQANLFGLCRILHDWPDEKVGGLLGAICERLPHGGGVLIAEKLLNEDKTGPTSALMQSLNMLVCTEGKERTLAEYRVLLEAAGFNGISGQITGAPHDAIFAIKP